MRHKARSTPRLSLLGMLLLGLLLAVSALSAQESTTYGFFRTVEGYADLTQGDSGTPSAVEVNFPVLTGDRLEVSPRGRIEVVLADGNYLRIDGDTELVFDRLAYSGDREDDVTLLRLIAGEIQLVLPGDTADTRDLRVDTVNATIYLEQEGSYRITTDGDSWTEVVARDGFAEVTSERGSAIVRSGERVLVEGTRWPHVSVEAAAQRDSLERWGDELLLAASERSSDYVDPSLAYEAAPLADHGRWLEVDGRRAWRPHVSIAWRPYWDGWWSYTPSGLSWVSHRPWGWLTHHYGNWHYSIGYGWIWYPGHVYSPGAVYWYWGPSHVAWIPIGYYTSYYRPYYHHFGFGLRFGIYGWAGGHGHYFSDWIFSPHYSFGYRYSHNYVHTGAQLTRRGVLQEVPRGIITTDTREVTPERLRRPDEIIDSLRASRTRREGGVGASQLPDVTEFVARRRQLSDSIRRAVSAEDGQIAIGAVGARRGRSTGSASTRQAAIRRASPSAAAPRGRELTRDGAVNSRFERLREDQRVTTERGRSTSIATAPQARRRSPNERRTPSTIVRRPSSERSVREITPRREPTSRGTPGSVSTNRTGSTRPDFRGRGTNEDRSWRERGVSLLQPNIAPRRLGSSTFRRDHSSTARRVWEGVRSYRSRSRTDLGSSASRSSGLSSSRLGDRSRPSTSTSRLSGSSSRARPSTSSSRHSARRIGPSSSRSSVGSRSSSPSRPSTRSGSTSTRRPSGSSRSSSSRRSSGSSSSRRPTKRGGG